MIAQNGFSRYPSPVQRNDRLSAMQSLLRKGKLPALLVSDPLNVRYLCGLKATEGLLLVTQRSATLIVDARYAEAAHSLRSKNLRVVDRSETKKLLSRISRCGFESHHVTVECLQRWRRAYKNIKFVQTLGLTEGLRRKKDAKEISVMNRARSVTNAVLKLVPSFLVPGVTEKQVADRILTEMLRRGADGLAFEAIVAFGKHSSRPHHRAGTAKLRGRDIVQIDVGAKVDGYCADRSEVYFVGEPTAEQRRAYDAVKRALRFAMRAAQAGVRCKDLDARARELLEHEGYPSYPHALGHGVGLDVHEGVVLAARSNDSLLAGEVIAVEPGVYFTGKFGIRLEDTVVVRRS